LKQNQNKIFLKKEEEILKMIEGGKKLVEILFDLKEKAKIGVSSQKLDELAEKLILKVGGKPAFKGYKPFFAKKPFPATICFSKNQTVVHGIPKKDLKIEPSDIIKIDIGMIWKGLYLDCAISLGFEPLSLEKKTLIKATLKALERGIENFKISNKLGDVGYAIENEIESYGFKAIYNLCGHGVGYNLHEEPEVLNYGKKGTGLTISSGLVVAIEPMASNTNFAKEAEDESFVTEDNSFSAHFEATVGILDRKTVIITPILREFFEFIKE